MRLRLAVAALVVTAALVAVPSALASPSGVVISQFRTRTAASPYDEYVQITNTTAAPVDLSGWRLYDCYTSGGKAAVGTDSEPLPAGTVLPAGKSFVFGKDIGDYSGEADATYHYQVTESGGFQLRDGEGTVQDAVGAPGTACAEGAGLTLPTTGSDFTFTRHGTPPAYVDTDENLADFGAPAGEADGTPCGPECEAPPAPTPIDAIQGSGESSPMLGDKVQITGIVIGVDNQAGVSNYTELDRRQEGIYVEAPTAEQDTNTQTSEGIFVGGLPAEDRSAEHIGQTVTVGGTVTELYGLTALEATGQTATFTGTAKRRNLPAPVVIDQNAAEAQSLAANGTRSYYESLEGMRVELPVGTADSGGTSKFGELFLLPGKARRLIFGGYEESQGPPSLIDTYQDAGSADVDPTDPSAEPASTTRVNADLFDRVKDLVGPLGFDFGNYGIVPQPGEAPKVVAGPTAYPPEAPLARRGTLRVANFNMENLFGVGMVDDGHTFGAEEIDAKTTRLANAIRLMHRPEVIAVEEVASEESLQEVADKLGGYRAIWAPSNDERHVAVGFLVDEGLDVTDIRQLGVEATTTVTGCNDNPADDPQLFERPPLEIGLKIGKVRFNLIANHWASQGHPEACREAQAAYVAEQVKAQEAAGGSVMVLGDLNAFQNSPSMESLTEGTSLRDLWSKAPADDRYSYAYDGLLETLDHIFVTKKLARQVEEIRYVHFDNDYYERNESTSPTGVSDHDPPVVRIAIPKGGL
ncbi:MAG TPA: lamin tail domain-containing protein [Solirubrobacterales bacterium]|nr:lamin tail domain-containing protein [Solirubrobacterales bacterium]